MADQALDSPAVPAMTAAVTDPAQFWQQVSTANNNNNMHIKTLDERVASAQVEY